MAVTAAQARKEPGSVDFQTGDEMAGGWQVENSFENQSVRMSFYS
jgi:hypothetical protein